MSAPIPALALATVLIACGSNATAPDAPTDAAAPSCTPGTPWASAPTLARGPTQETAVVAVGTDVYVLGGFDEDAADLDAVQVFDTAACAWRVGPPLPVALHHANAAVIDGTIYVAGALQGLGFTAIGGTWALTPGVDAAWRPRASLPAGTERGGGATGVVGGTLVVAGGLRGGAVAEVTSYDPATDAWTIEAPLPAARDHGCGAVVEGALYVIGGRQASIGSTEGTVYAWQPGAGWSTHAAMPTPRGGTACGVVGGEIIVVGGEGNPALASGVFAEVEAYAPATDTWRTLAPMPSPRHGMGAVGIDGALYVPGGADRQGLAAVATHEVLTPGP